MRNKKTYIVFILMYCFNCCFVNASDFSNQKQHHEMNYEDDLIHIYQYVVKNKEKIIGFRKNMIDQNPSNQNNKLIDMNKKNVLMIKSILKATQAHKLVLKNIVYQPDWENFGKNTNDCKNLVCDSEIRVTWADINDNMIIKVLYGLSSDTNGSTLRFKTDHYGMAIPRLDFVLNHSFYADKKKIDNIKVMYRKNQKEEYQYFEIDNNSEDKNSISDTQPLYLFKELGFKHCQSCHESSPDKRNNSLYGHGAFFPRYQFENNLTNIFPELKFKDDFFEIKTPEDAEKMGLPKMSDDFIYQKLHIDKNNKLINGFLESRYTVYDDFNILYTNTEVIEIKSIEKNKNYCLSIEMDNSPDKFYYICADLNKRIIYAKVDQELKTNSRNIEMMNYH